MRISRSPRAACAALAAVLGLALPGAARDLPDTSGFEPGEVIVRYEANVAASARAAIRKAVGGATAGAIEEIDAELLRIPGAVPAAVAVLRAMHGVAHAEPNMVGRVAGAPPPSRANDPLVAGIGTTFADRQWHLQRINAPYAWVQWPGTYYTSRSKPRNPLKVAVLDTIVDLNHQDWRNAGGSSPRASAGGQIDVANAVSLIPASQLGGGLSWHGTFVAGIIGAATDNAHDIAGIGYPAQILPITVARGDGTTNAFAVAKGVTIAVDRGAKVINASLTVTGTDDAVQTLRAAVNRAVSKGAVVVAAAGNSRHDDAEYPGGFAAENAGVMAVGASDVFDKRYELCSKKGRHLTVVAPGQLIWGLDPQDHSVSTDPTWRRETCGTSYATAIVSGVAALVAGKFQGISPAGITVRIAQTADDLPPRGRDDETGAGRVNAERALWTAGGAGAQWLSIPTAGTANRVTVFATAQSRAGILRAEILLDGRQRGTGIAARARDGRWGGASEGVLATIDTTNLSEGPHEIHVRAQDRSGRWGPAAAGVLIVDRSTPSVPPPVIFPKDLGPVVNPDDPRAAVLFTVNDNWSRSLRVKLDIIDETLTSVASFTFPALPSNQTYMLPWRDIEKRHDGPMVPGAYRVIVNAWDQVGLEANPYGDTAFVLLPTTRIVPSPGSSNGPVSTALPTAKPSPSPSDSATPDVSPLPSATPTDILG